MADTDNHAADSGPSLPKAQYDLIVAPVMQIATKVAAVRGDPMLYNDMATMLALMAVVQALGECYLHDHPETDATLRKAIDAAPMGACLLVLGSENANLTPEQINDCMWSLNKATQQLIDAEVINPSQLQKAAWQIWKFLIGKERQDAIKHIMLAITTMVKAIDQYERDRDRLADSEAGPVSVS
ncbi:MAG TPA: hypothetical protein VF265_01905 [Nevskiaceae bacterium]